MGSSFKKITYFQNEIGCDIQYLTMINTMPNLTKVSTKTGYGPHLMLDLEQCDSIALNCLETCFQFLYEAPEILGMTKITAPYVFRYNAPIPEEQGITGVVIIAESHISIHTYPFKQYAFVDMFSCKPFDVDKAKSFCTSFFKSQSYSESLVQRGQTFPRT